MWRGGGEITRGLFGVRNECPISKRGGRQPEPGRKSRRSAQTRGMEGRDLYRTTRRVPLSLNFVCWACCEEICNVTCGSHRAQCNLFPTEDLSLVSADQYMQRGFHSLTSVLIQTSYSNPQWTPSARQGMRRNNEGRIGRFPCLVALFFPWRIQSYLQVAGYP